MHGESRTGGEYEGLAAVFQVVVSVYYFQTEAGMFRLLKGVVSTQADGQTGGYSDEIHITVRRFGLQVRAYLVDGCVVQGQVLVVGLEGLLPSFLVLFLGDARGEPEQKSGDGRRYEQDDHERPPRSGPGTEAWKNSKDRDQGEKDCCDIDPENPIRFFRIRLLQGRRLAEVRSVHWNLLVYVHLSVQHRIITSLLRLVNGSF